MPHFTEDPCKGLEPHPTKKSARAAAAIKRVGHVKVFHCPRGGHFHYLTVTRTQLHRARTAKKVRANAARMGA